MDIGRTPLIALSYDQSYKAVNRELIMKFDRSNPMLYVNIDGELIDVTKSVKDSINNIGEDLIVNIPEYGEFQLSEALLKIFNMDKEFVKSKEYNDSTHYIRKSALFDNSSIEQKAYKVQVKGFDEANNNSLPIKRNGQLLWVDYGSAINFENGENPIDGLNGTVLNMPALNGKIYLCASRKQMSINLTTSCKVILPKTLDAYSEIKWNLKTNNYRPILTFPENLTWLNGDTRNIQPRTNKVHVYTFTTWDGGCTWLGKCEIYSGTYIGGGDTPPVSDDVTIDYLESNYFNIDEINDLLSWKIWGQTTPDNLLRVSNQTSVKIDTIYLSNNYYTKRQIDKLLQWSLTGEPIDISDPLEYIENVTVDYVSENYYSKADILEIIRWSGGE